MPPKRKAVHTGRVRDGHRLCAATSKATGKPCESFAMNGMDVCYMHGGKTPRGLAAPQTKTARFSNHMQTRLLSNFLAAADDPQLHSLRENIALLEARELDLMGRVATGDSAELWKRLRETVTKMQRLLYGEDSTRDDAPALIWEEMNRLGTLTAEGLEEWRTWAELSKVSDQKGRMIDYERRHAIALQQTITAQDFALTMGKFLEVIKANVTDRQQLSAVIEGIYTIVEQGAGK